MMIPAAAAVADSEAVARAAPSIASITRVGVGQVARRAKPITKVPAMAITATSTMEKPATNPPTISAIGKRR